MEWRRFSREALTVSLCDETSTIAAASDTMSPSSSHTSLRMLCTASAALMNLL